MTGVGDIFDHFADMSNTKCMENGQKTIKLTIRDNTEQYVKKTTEEQSLLILNPMIIEKLTLFGHGFKLRHPLISSCGF